LEIGHSRVRSLTLFKRQDSTRTRQFYCNMSDKEVDECAQWPEITEEELSFAENLWNRDSSPDEQRLDDWLRVMEEIVATIGYTYHSSFQLLKSNNLKNESLLEALRGMYIFAMAEVNVAKRKTTSS